MIVVTVARKPLDGTVATNALNWGSGGINIDASRIGNGGGTSRSNQMPYPKTAEGKEDRSGTWARTGHDIVEIHAGRWPANMIMSHLAGCNSLGLTKVKGNRTDTRPEGNGYREDRTQWRFRPTEATKRGYSDDDGTETVESWECVEGCSVAGLDGQSGFLHTRGNVNSEKTGGGMFGHPEFRRDNPLSYDRSIGEKGGGASRFFKTLKGE